MYVLFPLLNFISCYIAQFTHLLWLQPKLVAVSNSVSFANPKAPLYPRLSQGKSWNEVSFIASKSLSCFNIFIVSSAGHVISVLPDSLYKFYTDDSDLD